MDRKELIKGKIPTDETGITIKKSICAICGPGTNCGLDLYIKNGTIIKVEGGRWHKNSRGTLCAKGSATMQYVYHSDRIQTPLRRVGPKGSDEFEPITWEEAYTAIADKLNRLKREEGPQAAVFYVGFPMNIRPFVHRLARSYGTPNYCSASSTCSKAMELAQESVFGSFTVADTKNTECLVVWSQNPFYSDTSKAELILERKKAGMKMLVVDPRTSPIAVRADLHLRPRPGTDGALALAIAHVLIKDDLYDHEFVENYSVGFQEYANYVEQFSPQRGEDLTGVPAEQIVAAAHMIAEAGSAAIEYSASSVVHHTNGVQNYRAIFMLAALTGNYDRIGGNLEATKTFGNVCTGFCTREKEYQEIPLKDPFVQRMDNKRTPVWTEYFRETQCVGLPQQILTGDPYPIKAVVAFGLNSRMWPDTEHMLESLQSLDFFVNCDLFFTQACSYADIVLPACSSVERSELMCYGGGYMVVTEPAILPLYQSKSDFDIIIDLAKRLDLDDDLLRKGYEANVDWILEPSGMKIEDIRSYPEGVTAKSQMKSGTQAYKMRGFKTPSGKMEFYSSRIQKYSYIEGVDGLPKYIPPKYSAENTPDIARDYPFIVNTGSRLPMLIHSRTYRLPWIRSLYPRPLLDINPADGIRLGISQGDMVRLSTLKGSIELRANLTEIAMEGVVFLYHCLEEANANLLIEYDYTDPISGFPGYKSFLGKVEKV